MKKIVIIAFSISVVAASVAVAAEAAHAEFGWKDWLYKIINFAILVSLLVFFLGKPIKRFFAQRRELIERSIRESQEAKELAQKALQEVEEKLKLKDKEIQDILDTARKIGEQEKQQIIQETDKLRQKILEQARTNIEFELKMAKDALRLEAAELAIELSEKKIKERITPEEQQKLLQESIKIIEGRKN
ncbi:MAG: F0F1 ATP synthase subunit B [Thermodesulfovibrio sp.]|nr:F0F1 ATP synthase subunit B [Thermodesulfovibrio sp.]